MNTLSTHILDTSRGLPAADVSVTLERLSAQGEWQKLGKGQTNSDGRASIGEIESGTYRLTFETKPYFEKLGVPTLYPFVNVVFEKRAGDNRHFHIPLLLNPFGYSTYRGT